jgi:hypothetical protein
VASIGDLVINISASSAKLNAALKSAQKQLNVFAAATTAAATAAFATFMQVGSALDDMSQRTGIAASELSTLAYAAQLSDTTMEAFQGSIFKMNMFLGALAEQSPAAVSALDKLGIKLSDLHGLSPDQQFKVFVDAISKIEDPMLRMNAAMSVFGKAAGELLPLLSQGASGIDAMQAEAKRLAFALSDDTAAAAAASADAIDNLTLAVKAAAVRFGALFAPAITAVAKTLGELLATSPKLFAAIAGGAVALAAVVGAFKILNLALDLYAKRQVLVLALTGPKGWAILAGAALVAAGAFAAVAAQTGKMNEQMAQAERQQKKLGEGLGGAGGPDQAMTGSADAQSRIAAIRDEMRILRGETTQFGLELERLAQAGATRQDLQQLQMMEMHRQRILFLQEQERKKQEAIADQVERAARAQEQQQQAMQNRAESIIESLKSPTDKLRERQAEIASLRAANLLTALQAQQALQKAEDDFAGPKAPIKPAEFQAASAMQKGSQEAFSAILRSMQTKDPQVAAINKMDKNLASKMDEMTGAILTIQTAGVA